MGKYRKNGLIVPRFSPDLQIDGRQTKPGGHIFVVCKTQNCDPGIQKKAEKDACLTRRSFSATRLPDDREAAQ